MISILLLTHYTCLHQGFRALRVVCDNITAKTVSSNVIRPGNGVWANLQPPTVKEKFNVPLTERDHEKLHNKHHLIQFTGLTDIAFSKGLRKNVDITIARVVTLPVLAGLRPILYEPRRRGNKSFQILLIRMGIDLNTTNSIG